MIDSFVTGVPQSSRLFCGKVAALRFSKLVELLLPFAGRDMRMHKRSTFWTYYALERNSRQTSSEPECFSRRSHDFIRQIGLGKRHGGHASDHHNDEWTQSSDTVPTFRGVYPMSPPTIGNEVNGARYPARYSSLGCFTLSGALALPGGGLAVAVLIGWGSSRCCILIARKGPKQKTSRTLSGRPRKQESHVCVEETGANEDLYEL